MMSLSPKLMKKLAKNGFTLEQIDFIEKEVYMDFKRENNYKIMCGKTYCLVRRVRNNTNYYCIMMKCKNSTNYYKEVAFYDCEKPNYDKCCIVINQFYESYHKNKNNVLESKLVIKDYDLVVDNEIERINALRKYISDVEKSKDSFLFSELDKNIKKC